MNRKIVSVFVAVLVLSLAGVVSGSSDAVADPGSGEGGGAGNLCNSLNLPLGQSACVHGRNDADGFGPNPRSRDAVIFHCEFYGENASFIGSIIGNALTAALGGDVLLSMGDCVSFARDVLRTL